MGDETQKDDSRDREIWERSGVGRGGDPEEWPDLFKAFKRALEMARADATDNALEVAAEIIRG